MKEHKKEDQKGPEIPSLPGTENRPAPRRPYEVIGTDPIRAFPEGGDPGREIR